MLFLFEVSQRKCPKLNGIFGQFFFDGLTYICRCRLKICPNISYHQFIFFGTEGFTSNLWSIPKVLKYKVWKWGFFFAWKGSFFSNAFDSNWVHPNSFIKWSFLKYFVIIDPCGNEISYGIRDVCNDETDSRALLKYFEVKERTKS